MISLLFAVLMQAAAPQPDLDLPRARLKHIPSIYERALAYPSQAAATRRAGKAVLRCRITNIGSAAGCSVFSEDPAQLGFGKAALSLVSKMSFYQPEAGQGPWFLVEVNFDPDPRKELYLH